MVWSQSSHPPSLIIDLFPKQHIYEKIIYKESSPPHIGLDRWLDVETETIQIPLMR